MLGVSPPRLLPSLCTAHLWMPPARPRQSGLVRLCSRAAAAGSTSIALHTCTPTLAPTRRIPPHSPVPPPAPYVPRQTVAVLALLRSIMLLSYGQKYLCSVYCGTKHKHEYRASRGNHPHTLEAKHCRAQVAYWLQCLVLVTSVRYVSSKVGEQHGLSAG